MAGILIVEDEEHIAEALQLHLEAAGHSCRHVDNGDTALRVIMEGGHDIVLLDVMLPGLDGFEVCRRAREQGARLPILFLTAKDLESDRVLGLELGGDDYLTKPFSTRELLARIDVMLRRQSWYNQPPAVGTSLRFGGHEVNFESYEAKLASGERVRLTQKECMLLKLLAEKDGMVVERAEILDRIWGYEHYPSTRTVDNLVLHLRKYFEPDPAEPRHFLSVYRVGYRFVRTPETD
ncbi:MAG: response regulator transcription factor [bacterium]|jgi:two-component system alkaline phosphatase synthesis response regulator PhoP|nr:response regulator transcription factor [bacterium]